MRLLGALAVLLALAGPAYAGRAVAVMPFRNVSGDPKLDWLSLGIAEALVSDLRKLKAFKVVERTHIEAALTELKLQKNADATTRAAEIGKLTGARLLVLGGYQIAGGTARLTARFVDVESGEVEDAAKVTGPLRDIFALEDRIVDQLTARYRIAVSPRERAEVRKVPTRKVEAFRLYALALGAGSSDEKRAYLRGALALDPRFSYALEDLAALEKRIEGYRETRDRVVDAQAAELKKQVAAPADAQQGYLAAVQLFASRMQSQKWRKLLEEAQQVYASPPAGAPPGGMNLKEYASLCIVQAHAQLKQLDRALQAGERHLREFPGGMYFQAVEAQMSSLIQARRNRAEGAAKLAEALQRIAEERAEAVQRKQDVRVRSLDLRACTEAHSNAQYARALELCPAYRKQHPPTTGTPSDELYWLTYYMQAQSLAELGRFDDARALVAELLRLDPGADRRWHIKTVMQFWPRD